MNEEMLHIPISATYEVDHETGQVTRTAAEYADVSADLSPGSNSAVRADTLEKGGSQ